MSWEKVLIEPLDLPTFRAPGPGIGAGIHGPAIKMATLSYPMPSTTAGAIASCLLAAGRANPPKKYDPVKEPMGDLESILSDAEVRVLRPGLVEAGNYYAYLGFGRLPRIDWLLKTLSKIADIQKPQCVESLLINPLLKGKAPHVTAITASYTGIALESQTKTVVEGLLYERERLVYKPKARLAVFAEAGKPIPKCNAVIGADRAVALMAPRPDMEPSRLLVRGRGRRWAIVLLTPALLDPDKTRLGLKKVWPKPPIINQDFAERLARTLLNKTSSSEIDSKLLFLPRNELSLAVILPGWSSWHRGPRKPMLMVPPGLILSLKADPDTIRNIAREGIGHYSKLGWGTIAAASAEDV